MLIIEAGQKDFNSNMDYKIDLDLLVKKQNLYLNYYANGLMSSLKI